MSAQRLLGMAFLATFFSGFGQTFLVGLFSGAWREEFGLSNAGMGLLYSGATLVSGLVIVKVGRWLDVVPLHRYVTATVAVFAIACAVVAGATGPIMLAVGLFLIRQCGQGLMGHIAMTTIARHFTSGRGRALAVAQLGFPAAEAIFPPLVVVGLALTDWRNLWWIAAGLLVLLLPLMRGLTRGVCAPAHEEHRDDGVAHASRRDVLRDPRFWRVLPVVLTVPFVVTGLFFHQAAIAEAKDWPLSRLANGFVAYAVTQVLGGLATGWAIDRWSARRLLRWFLLPMAAGCTVLALADASTAAFGYLGLMGLSGGASGALSGALWAELYGTRHLGAIRAMQHAFMVVSTAASPILFGLLLDGGVGVPALALTLAAFCALIAPLLGGAAAHPAPNSATPSD